MRGYPNCKAGQKIKASDSSNCREKINERLKSQDTIKIFKLISKSCWKTEAGTQPQAWDHLSELENNLPALPHIGWDQLAPLAKVTPPASQLTVRSFQLMVAKTIFQEGRNATSSIFADRLLPFSSRVKATATGCNLSPILGEILCRPMQPKHFIHLRLHSSHLLQCTNKWFWKELTDQQGHLDNLN